MIFIFYNQIYNKIFINSTDWKKGTLKTLVKRAKTICSNENVLKTEIEHLRKVFVEIDSYLRHIIIDGVINQELSRNLDTIQENDQTKEPTETVQLIVLYTGKQGHKIIFKIKKDLSKALLSILETMVTYQRTKFSTKFNIKNQTKFQHKNNIVYYDKCLNIKCKNDYVGETNRRSIERIIDHNKREKKSQLLKYAQDENMPMCGNKILKLLVAIINQV